MILLLRNPLPKVTKQLCLGASIPTFMKVIEQSFHFQRNQNATLSGSILLQDCKDRTRGQLIRCNLRLYFLKLNKKHLSVTGCNGAFGCRVYPHFTWKLWCPLILLIGPSFSHEGPKLLASS